MKQATLLFTVLFLLIYQPIVIFSQNGKITPHFKIIGKTKSTTILNSAAFRTVEYDPDSPDHLYISNFNKDSLIISKYRFLFNGKRFNLEKLIDYFAKSELLLDGIQTINSEDGRIQEEQFIQKGNLLKKTFYYSDGKKRILSSGDEETLDGEFKMWYKNGQVSFIGNYKKNLKDGEFFQFDPSGTLIRKGIYQEGKLKSGETVIPEIIYKKPDVYAQYIKGDKAFDEYLKIRSSGIVGLSEIKEEKSFNLSFVIDKTGKVNKMEILSGISPLETEIIKAIFNELPAFLPAQVEKIPVESELILPLMLSKEGVKIISEKPFDVYLNVDQMPVFPGGLLSLRRFIAVNLTYPTEALQRKIQGKVLVNFIIDEEGNVSNIKIQDGFNSSLNEEAIRVVKLMPKWEPGLMQGKPVKVAYTVPIIFKMQFIESFPTINRFNP